jgi:hypothetical protein
MALNDAALEAQLVPGVAILGGLALAGLAMYFRHQERMTRWADAGAAPSGRTASGLRGSPLEGALTTVGVGLGLLAGFLPLGAGPWLIPGLVVLFLGLVRMAMLTWGLEPWGPPPSVPTAVRRGLYTTAIGLALLLGLATLGIGVWLVAGTIPLGIGLGRLAAAWLGARGWPRP